MTHWYLTRLIACFVKIFRPSQMTSSSPRKLHVTIVTGCIFYDTVQNCIRWWPSTARTSAQWWPILGPVCIRTFNAGCCNTSRRLWTCDVWSFFQSNKLDLRAWCVFRHTLQGALNEEFSSYLPQTSIEKYGAFRGWVFTDHQRRKLDPEVTWNGNS